MDRKARSGTRGSLTQGRRRYRVCRVLPMRLASKRGRCKSAAFFRDPLTRFNQHPKTLRAWETPRCGRRRPCATPLVTDPGDLIARALEILAEEDEAWRARRGLDLTPRSIRWTPRRADSSINGGAFSRKLRQSPHQFRRVTVSSGAFPNAANG